MTRSIFSFGKQEKLKSRKLIEQLFAGGKGINVPPLRMVFIEPAVKLDFPVKMGVSVSSRNFKKAVDRNRIKRLLREAYRLNKQELLAFTGSSNKQVAGFILYTDKTLPRLEILDKKMQVLLKKLISVLSETPSKDT